MAMNFARWMPRACPMASEVNPAALQTAAEACDGMSAADAATRTSAANNRFIFASRFEAPTTDTEAPLGDSGNLHVSGPAGNQGTSVQQASELALA
jgi:hypothetical protein